jgi:hypothetical protein
MNQQSKQSFSWGPQLRASSTRNLNKQKHININKPNIHNAAGNHRRGRRPKISLRTTAGQRGGAVTQVAKMPAVQILTISNVRSDILEAIDELAAKQDRSRSSFVRRELERIVAEYKAKAELGKPR